MEEIKNWLTGPRDYDQGKALFAKYSRNRRLSDYFNRKSDMPRLVYNLEKLANVPSGKLARNSKGPKQSKANIKLKVVKMGKVDYDKLSPDKKELYDETIEMYKKCRSLHEKIKHIPKDEDRKKVANELAKLDKQIRNNWRVIDGKSKLKKPKKSSPDSHNRINANRKFITNNKKKLKQLSGKKRDEMLAKIQARVDELLKAGQNLNRQKEELKKMGIKI